MIARIIEVILCAVAFLLLTCDGCDAEAQEARVCYDFRSGTGPARKGDAGADDVSSRGADRAATQQPLPAMGHETGTFSAQPARVEARQVCEVHRAVSHRKPLPPETCATIARAMNDTDEPVRMLALAVNESGTRPEAIRVHVRTDGLVAYDTGILQVRCLVDPARKDTVCLNGPAKGLTVKRLLSPVVNIRTAWAVYEMHGRDPGRYNGATGKRAKRYRQRIEAIEAALLGLPFAAPDRRAKDLCRRITEALKGERKS